MEKAKQLLDYLATNPDATIQFMLGNHEARGASGKLCMSQNNHTVSILTGCAGDGKPLKIIGKPLKKAESR